ncbi:MAG: hypothetical protein ABF685_17030 [Clostridium saccharoperbutylacetonicum]
MIALKGRINLAMQMRNIDEIEIPDYNKNIEWIIQIHSIFLCM